MLVLYAAAMQDRPLASGCGKPFSPGQAARYGCCAGVCAVLHDSSVPCAGAHVLRNLGRLALRSGVMLISRVMFRCSHHCSTVSLYTFMCLICLAVLVLIP
jgi:hypothetical protein